jgi:aldose 1-epimerase
MTMENATMLVTSPFGALPDGADVTAFTLGSSDDGLRLTVLDLGATVARLQVPAGDGPPVDVVLGLAAASDYAAETNPFLGATVGRYANRIAGSRFTLDGTEHRLVPNEGTTCLHGGPGGFHSRQWLAVAATSDTLELELVSPDGDQGFPGRVRARVRYQVTADTVTIEHRAETDAPTVVSLTNHTYFNLAADGTVDDHVLEVAADEYLPVDARSIPTGSRELVQDSPFDFRDGVALAGRVGSSHPQVRQAGGIDHAFVLTGEGLRRVARLEHPASARTLEVSTTQSSMQVYTGQQLDGTLLDRAGRRLPSRAGIALECQAFPDAPNQPQFPSAVLEPGEEYRATTVWRLSGW